MSERVILHYDLDAFYASVEIRDNPKLKNKALVVGESVVTTASYEARKYGVHSAMSTAEAKKLCPNLIVLSCDKSKYAAESRYIHSLVEKITDKIEYIAFDEGFLDITEIIENYPSKEYFAQKFKERIFKNTGLTCSVGIGYNKLTAKIASDYNKPNGFYIFNNSNEFIEHIKDKNIKIIPGVGKKFIPVLEKYNIFKPADIYKYSLHDLISLFGLSRGSLLYYYSRGLDDSPVKKERKAMSVGNENTYRYPLQTEEDLVREYTAVFEKSYKRLKEKDFLCSCVNIKIKYQDFTSVTRSKQIPIPTNNKGELLSTVSELMDKLEKRENIRLVGVSFSHLIKKNMLKVQLAFKF